MTTNRLADLWDSVLVRRDTSPPDWLVVDVVARERSAWSVAQRKAAEERAAKPAPRLLTWKRKVRAGRVVEFVDRSVFRPSVGLPLSARLEVLADKADRLAKMGEVRRARLARPLAIASSALIAASNRAEHLAARKARRAKRAA